MTTNSNPEEKFGLSMTSKLNIVNFVYNETKKFCENTFSNPQRYIERIFRSRLDAYFVTFYSQLGRSYRCEETSETFAPSVPQRAQYKKVKILGIKFKKCKLPQKMSEVHGILTNDNIAKLLEEVEISSYCDVTNKQDKILLETAKFLSKKYSKSEYAYCQYFFMKLKASSLKHDAKLQQVNYTTFAIKTLEGDDVTYMNKKVQQYVDQSKKVSKARIKLLRSKHSLNKLEVYTNYKKFDNLVKEYRKSIEDILFKIKTYDNVNVLHNEALKESFECLLKVAIAEREQSKILMDADQKYINKVDKIALLKADYKNELKVLVDSRRSFKEYLIFKKIAAYKYLDKDNKICINGIKWSLKTPSGKLNDKTTLSNLQKTYDKVVFDKVTKSLRVHEGL